MVGQKDVEFFQAVSVDAINTGTSMSGVILYIFFTTIPWVANETL